MSGSFHQSLSLSLLRSSKIHTQVEEKEEEEEEEETRSAKQCLQCPKPDASILTFLSVSCNKYSKKKKEKKKPSQALKVAQNYSTCCREGEALSWPHTHLHFLFFLIFAFSDSVPFRDFAGAFSFSIFGKRLLLQDDGEEL